MKDEIHGSRIFQEASHALHWIMDLRITFAYL